jgi:hypothetical protein
VAEAVCLFAFAASCAATIRYPSSSGLQSYIAPNSLIKSLLPLDNKSLIFITSLKTFSPLKA